MASPSNATTTVAKSPSRSPLKRSATAPLYGPSHANINLSTASSSSSLSNASSSGKGKTITMTSAGPSASQYKDNCNTAVKSTLPSDGWDKVMQAALCRLSSQHQWVLYCLFIGRLYTDQCHSPIRTLFIHVPYHYLHPILTPTMTSSYSSPTNQLHLCSIICDKQHVRL